MTRLGRRVSTLERLVPSLPRRCRACGGIRQACHRTMQACGGRKRPCIVSYQACSGPWQAWREPPQARAGRRKLVTRPRKLATRLRKLGRGAASLERLGARLAGQASSLARPGTSLSLLASRYAASSQAWRETSRARFGRMLRRDTMRGGTVSSPKGETSPARPTSLGARRTARLGRPGRRRSCRRRGPPWGRSTVVRPSRAQPRWRR